MKSTKLIFGLFLSISLLAYTFGSGFDNYLPIVSQPVDTPIPTSTNTQTPTITKTPTLTPTATRTPTTTPTITSTRTLAPTSTSTATQAPQNQKQKGDGWFLVNSEIAPGLWRSTPGSSSCYWERDKDLNKNLGSILGNFYGPSGSLINIQPGDMIVEFIGCGTWTYIQNMPKVLQPNATSPHNDGVYMVGVDIAPGTWRTTAGTNNCYWERDRDATGSLTDIINNYWGLSGGFIVITSTDLEVQISHCNSTTYINP